MVNTTVFSWLISRAKVGPILLEDSNLSWPKVDEMLPKSLANPNTGQSSLIARKFGSCVLSRVPVEANWFRTTMSCPDWNVVDTYITRHFHYNETLRTDIYVHHSLSKKLNHLIRDQQKKELRVKLGKAYIGCGQILPQRPSGLPTELDG